MFPDPFGSMNELMRLLLSALFVVIAAGVSRWQLEAVRLQIIVMYMLVGAVTFTGLVAAYLTYRAFFTNDHQLVKLES